MFCHAFSYTDSIGKPIANYLCYVVHPHITNVENGDKEEPELCPPNVWGELWIGGLGVTNGYLNRPELTAEKFLPNPFGGVGKVYRTGDRVKWSPDGQIVFGGRFDDQVKLRGFRIELGEVEANLEDLYEIDAAVAVVKNQNLFVYVILNPEVSAAAQESSNANNAVPIDTNELLDFLRETIPKHMVPVALIVLDEFPLTPNQKVDKKTLPEIDVEQMLANSRGGDGVRAYTPPRNAEEAVICEVWKELLELEKDVGIHDNFFQLGGHSLLAMKFASRTGYSMPLLMQFPTVAELVACREQSVGRRSLWQ